MLSIVLLTVAVTVATAPLTVMAARSQRRLSALQPQLAELRRTFANDRQRLMVESNALMKASGVSLAAGCMPMLVQAPIFIAMFQYVSNLAKNGLQFGPVDLAQTGVAAFSAGATSAWFLVAVLVVMVGSSLLQMRLTPRRAVGAEEMPGQTAMRWLPVAFSAWALWFPLAVGVYYATSSLLRVGLQWSITRHWSA